MADSNPRKVYVGNLPRLYTEENLRKDFGRFGHIYRTEFKGRFGFVEYDTVGAATEAVRAMDDARIGTDRIQVKPYNYTPSYGVRGSDYRGVGNSERTQYRVIVLNLHDKTTWRELKDFGRRVGIVNYADVMRSSDGSFKGILEFQHAEAMRNAIEGLSGQDILGRPVRIIPESVLNEPERHRDYTPEYKKIIPTSQKAYPRKGFESHRSRSPHTHYHPHVSHPRDEIHFSRYDSHRRQMYPPEIPPKKPYSIPMYDAPIEKPPSFVHKREYYRPARSPSYIRYPPEYIKRTTYSPRPRERPPQSMRHDMISYRRLSVMPPDMPPRNMIHERRY